MNPEYLAPGAYVEESRSGPQRIVGTPTAVTAFIGATPWGRARQPVMVTSFGDFTRRFGGLSRSLPLGHAVRLYFANGGRRACVVRSPAHLTLAGLQRALTALATEREIGLLQLPALTDQRLLAVALAFAERRRLFLIVDSPERATTAELTRFASVLGGNPAGQFAAVYHPWVVVADSPSQSRAMTVAPGGAVAGLIARTDETRGVWKAPAGAEAKLKQVTGLATHLGATDLDALNRVGVNALRDLPGSGIVCWGNRTLAASNAASEWKYLPVRRTALFIETSIRRGMGWTVFEPNDEPLWARVRTSVGAFLMELFRAGAFQGRTAEESWFVRCDRGTMTAADIQRGILNLDIGFAPLRPAEFVVLRISFRAATGRHRKGLQGGDKPLVNRARQFRSMRTNPTPGPAT